MSLKILHVINGWALGGIAQATLDLIKNTPTLSHYSIGYCWTNTPVKKEFEEAGCHSIICDDKYSNIKDILISYGINIVHKQTGGGDFPEWVKICKELKIPIVESLHCPRTSGIPKELIAATVITTDYVGDKNTDRPLLKIPYPCTLPLGSPRNLPRNRRLVIGRMARYESDKIPMVIIKVAYILWEFKNDIEFLIMGYPFNQNLYKEISDESEEGYIKVEGLQSDKLTAINRLDVCLDPVWETSFDMVMTEAMSQGIPVVTWDNSAAPEVCGTGGIVSKATVFDLAQAVRSLIGNEDYSFYSRMAINKIRNNHDPVKYGQLFTNLYRRLLNET